VQARLTVEAQMLKGFVATAHPSRVTNAQNLEIIATGSPRSFAAGPADEPSWALTAMPHITTGMRKLVRARVQGLGSSDLISSASVVGADRHAPHHDRHAKAGAPASAGPRSSHVDRFALANLRKLAVVMGNDMYVEQPLQTRLMMLPAQ